MIEIKDSKLMSYEEAYLASVIAANNMKYIHWNATGKSFDRIHDMAGEYYDKLAEEMDFFAELCLQNNIPIKNPCLLCNESGSLLFTNDSFEYEDGILAIQTTLLNYLTVIGNLSSELAGMAEDYGAFASAQQSDIDTIYAYWQKEIDFKLKRRMPKRKEPVENFDEVD